MGKPIPRPTPTEKPFYDGCARHELQLQHCQHCAHVLFYPRTLCDHCSSENLIWQVASGLGTIASYTVVRRSVSSDYEAPYVIALIDLVEGPRMMSQIIDVDPGTLAVGLPVSVDFAAWSEDITLPVFRLQPAARVEGD
jgi:uncharacterized protein